MLGYIEKDMNQFTIERTSRAFIFTPKQKEQSDFRILQVTDMHLPHIGIADRRELKEIAAMARALECRFSS